MDVLTAAPALRVFFFAASAFALVSDVGSVGSTEEGRSTGMHESGGRASSLPSS